MDRAINIRAARQEDAAMLASLIHQARQGMHSHYTAMFLETNLPADEPEDYQELMKRREIFVAEHEGRVVGTAALKGISLGMFFVDIHMQGQGIGRALLEHLNALAVQRQLPSLQVYASLNAVPFYESCGFVEIRPEISHAQFPAIFMQKRLSSTGLALLYYSPDHHDGLPDSLRKDLDKAVFTEPLGRPQELFILESDNAIPVALLGGVVTYDFKRALKGFEVDCINLANGISMDQIFSAATLQLAQIVFFSGGRSLSFRDAKLQQKMNAVLEGTIKGISENDRFFMSYNRAEDFMSAA